MKKLKLVHVSGMLISCPSRTNLEFALKSAEKSYGLSLFLEVDSNAYMVWFGTLLKKY